LGLRVIAWQARSSSTEGRVMLSAGDRMWIAGSTRPARTVRERNRNMRESDALVRELCTKMSYELHEGDTFWTVRVDAEHASSEIPEQNQRIDSADSAAPVPSEERREKREERIQKREERIKEPPTPVAAAPEPLFAELEPEPESDRVRPIQADPIKAQIRRIWPEVQAAAAKHGKRWETLTPDRAAKLAARLREHGPDPQVLVKAVHGAIAYWKKTMPDKDMLVYLTPDTVYRPGHFAKYIEFATDPKTAPQRPFSEWTREERQAFARAQNIA
jgi:hypothetical protein